MADTPNSGDKPKKRMPKGVPFQKGDPRINRAGRPKALEGWRDVMRDKAEKARRVHEANIDAALALQTDDLSEAANAIRKIGGASASFVIEQGWGKASQAIEVTGKDGKDLVPDGAQVAQQLLAELQKLEKPAAAPAEPEPAPEVAKP